ncbi:hypothetical protein BGZ65_001256, partial [Modicella reniformis]
RMVFGLSTPQILELAGYHMENARKTEDDKLRLVLCENAESDLSRVRKVVNWAPKYRDNQELRRKVADAFFKLGDLQLHLGQTEKAEASHKKAKKCG